MRINVDRASAGEDVTVAVHMLRDIDLLAYGVVALSNVLLAALAVEVVRLRPSP